MGRLEPLTLGGGYEEAAGARSYYGFDKLDAEDIANGKCRACRSLLVRTDEGDPNGAEVWNCSSEKCERRVWSAYGAAETLSQGKLRLWRHRNAPQWRPDEYVEARKGVDGLPLKKIRHGWEVEVIGLTIHYYVSEYDLQGRGLGKICFSCEGTGGVIRQEGFPDLILPPGWWIVWSRIRGIRT